ncbi:MAG: ScyD/ScyE family protein [Sphaerobacteraceae bacterium]|nr:MAG: ScyD/ScyE family protein [Sphaerobacteraceae bacterium]
MRRSMLLALLLFIASIVPVAASQSGEDAYAEWTSLDYCEYFEQTDKYLCFGFRSYWHEYGGLEIFGYPITNEIQEDGLTVQYFERARLEWHPGVWPERHDVLQGRLGAELTRDQAGQGPFAPVDAAKDGCEYFPQTGHNVCDNFLKRWQMSGGLPVFGYPISEAFTDDDGVLVQYFERQKMEYLPGEWPERYDVLFVLIGVDVWESRTDPAPPPQPELTVVASDLVQPRGLLYSDHGLFIAEAGEGGDGPCITLGSGAEGCVGESSALTILDDEGQRRLVDGISSLVEESGEGIGIHDIAVDDDGEIYVVVGLGANPEFLDDLGEAGGDLASILHIGLDGEVTFIADLALHEELENPDGTDLDTNPYGIAWDGEALIVADAGGNSVLRVSLDGDVETVAVLESRMVPSPPFIPGDEMPMNSVPTNVAVGPDGNYYVAELTGFPFPVGEANIYKITPDGDVSVHASGFTNLGDLTFDDHGNLWALEIVAGGLLNADPEDPSTLASRIIKIAPDGTQTDYMFQGMAFATGITVGSSGEIYVANLAVTPMAHVLRIDLP